MPAATTYLDHNATAPLRPQARAAMLSAMEAVSGGGNPSSVHGAGRAARRIVEDARARVAELAGCTPDEVIFTSGGTEANNLAVMGAWHTADAESYWEFMHVLTQPTEHPSVLQAAEARDYRGKPGSLPVQHIGVDSNGVVSVENLKLSLSVINLTLVCLMSANNETGVEQPVGDIADFTHGTSCWLHVDAVQSAGKTSLHSLKKANSIALSSHKIGGPAGVGALIVRGRNTLRPHMHGGGQELRRRAGTENVIGIAGFGAAAQAASESITTMQALAPLRDAMEERVLTLAATKGHAAQVIGHAAPRLPNTSCIAFDGVSAETLLMALDLNGVCVSSGSACSSGKVARSHVLDAMGVAPDLAQGAIRVSLGWTTTADDIDRFCTSLGQALSVMSSPRTPMRVAGE